MTDEQTDQPTTDELATRFHRDGYVVVEDFYPAGLMDELEATCRQHFGVETSYLHERTFVDATEVEIVPWFPQREGSSAFDALETKRLADLTTAVLGDGWRADSCLVMHSNPLSKGQSWHQDCPPDRHQAANLNRLTYGRDTGGRLGGELVVVPGSHHRGPLPTGEPHGALDGARALTPPAGALVLLHGHCWHRVEAVGPEARHSINLRALPAGAPADLTDICLYRNLRYRFSTAEILEHR